MKILYGTSVSLVLLIGIVASTAFVAAQSVNNPPTAADDAAAVAEDSTDNTLTVTVSNVNDLPTATHDTFSLDEGATLNVVAVGVLAGDTAIYSNPLTAVLVSEVTQLLQLLSSDDKEKHAQFITDFHEFKDVVEGIFGIGQGKGQDPFQTRMVESQLDKMELKLQIQSLRIQDDDLKKEKIKQATEFTRKNEGLQELRPKMTLVMTENDWQEKNKKMEELRNQEVNMLRSIMMIEEVQNGKQVTPDVLNEIDKKIDEMLGTPKDKGNDKSGGNDNSNRGGN